MGTGLWVVCPPDPSLLHLTEYSQRITPATPSTWVEVLFERLKSDELFNSDHRLAESERALALSYEHLINRSLEALANHHTP